MKSEESWGRLDMRSNWDVKRLDEIAEFNPRETIKKGSVAKKIAMDVLQPFTRDVPSFEVTEFKGGTKFRNGDTIMARITPCLENGKTAKVSILNEDEVGFGSTEYIVFRPKEVTDEDYLYYLVCSPTVREPAIKSMVGSSGRQRVQTDVVKGLEIPVPPYEEQIKIGKLLKDLDDKIKLNTEINKNLEEQAFAIFNEMFVDSIYGENLVGDILTPNRGKGLLSKDAVPGNVPVVAGGLEPATYHNQSNTVAPVLTISASGANAGYVNLWNVPVWSSDSSFIDTTMTEDVYFWYAMLKSRQSEIFDAQTGSAQPHIYPKHIAGLPMGNISPDEINQYNVLVSPLFEAIGDNKEENLSLASIRDALLPKLMSGEIDVSDIDL
ncbi:restriction endonuclease subunit S [Facklamia hominis]|uniref:restriction endonuclease subunit S n=2 Tax=Facklamia hominis TaxID=178214 RepID=UPI0029D41CC1|nr:restriction endonuclease subunit S [Facklamia hominis]WPJ90346.1 restriction endonuclease subunit S [Facklamia hominis]